MRLRSSPHGMCRMSSAFLGSTGGGRGCRLALQLTGLEGRSTTTRNAATATATNPLQGTWLCYRSSTHSHGAINRSRQPLQEQHNAAAAAHLRPSTSSMRQLLATPHPTHPSTATDQPATAAPEPQHVVDAAARGGRPVLLIAASKVQVAARALAKQVDLTVRAEVAKGGWTGQGAAPPCGRC